MYIAERRHYIALEFLVFELLQNSLLGRKLGV